jgi:hypothetical protein
MSEATAHPGHDFYGQPGSIGAISARIGYDVRDLIVAGYSDRQIWRVVRGEITLTEQFAEEPDGREAA